MAHFCNQFDKVCTELGCAVIYCHHHSKGSQGNKRSMDRASGSGVFARDPDALIDLIELELTDNIYKAIENKVMCGLCSNKLKHIKDWDLEVSQDDLCSSSVIMKQCQELISNVEYKDLEKQIEIAKTEVRQRSAWRIEGTLREFPKFAPVNMWFNYPIHIVDKSGVLNDVGAEGEAAPWKKNLGRKKSKEDLKKERKEALETAYEACGIEGKVTVKALAEYSGKSEDTIRNYIKEHGGFWIDNGEVGRK